MPNPLAVILAGLGSGLDRYADYATKMTQAKQLADMEDQLLRQRQMEAAQRDEDLYRKKLLMQAGVGMPDNYTQMVKSIYDARRRPAGTGGGKNDIGAAKDDIRAAIDKFANGG